jgi:hypothetical protein
MKYVWMILLFVQIFFWVPTSVKAQENPQGGELPCATGSSGWVGGFMPLGREVWWQVYRPWTAQTNDCFMDLVVAADSNGSVEFTHFLTDGNGNCSGTPTRIVCSANGTIPVQKLWVRVRARSLGTTPVLAYDPSTGLNRTEYVSVVPDFLNLYPLINPK